MYNVTVAFDRWCLGRLVVRTLDLRLDDCEFVISGRRTIGKTMDVGKN